MLFSPIQHKVLNGRQDVLQTIGLSAHKGSVLSTTDIDESCETQANLQPEGENATA